MRLTALLLSLISVGVGIPQSVLGNSIKSLPNPNGCNDREMYLEPYLAQKPDPGFCGQCARDAANQFFGIQNLLNNTRAVASTQEEAVSKQPPLPEACFVSSMNLRPAGYGFKYTVCETPQSKPTHARPALPPPCVTHTLTNSVQTALASSMNCLGIDQHEVFSLFGWESHYQMNIHYSGGIGIGQLTSVAVADIDMNKRFAEDVNKPECQEFASVFKTSGENYHSLKSQHGHYPTTSACQWIAPPENPARSLLYAGAIYRMDKRLAMKLASSLGSTPAESSRIATEIARYMYNGGSGAIRNLVRLYHMRISPRRVKFSEFKSEFHSVVQNNFGSAEDEVVDDATKQRVASYARHIDDHARIVEKQTGGAKCSE